MSRSVLLLSCTPQPLLKICVCNFIVFQRAPLYRADSVEYRAPSAGLETGSDTVPPTPAFPISPPTPYGKTLTHKHTHLPYVFTHLHKPGYRSVDAPLAVVPLRETLLGIAMGRPVVVPLRNRDKLLQHAACRYTPNY